MHNLADVDRQMTSLREWKAKGKIRYTGITHSEDRGHGEVERVMRAQKPDFVQINYSLMDRAAAQRSLPLSSGNGHGVIINRPSAAAVFSKSFLRNRCRRGRLNSIATPGRNSC